ncbi:MAG: hypothetical protein KAG53_10500 [Endozoicomonadaceae bacterium]|nr:hypothetical protein [Endozoicomonadaceae bacterium]
MIESNSNRLEIRSEVCRSIEQSNRLKKSKQKSNFMNKVVVANIIASKRIPFAGCLNFLLLKYSSINRLTIVDQQKISNRTVLISLSTFHVAVLMGGLKGEPSHDSISKGKDKKNIMNWMMNLGYKFTKLLIILDPVKNFLYKSKTASILLFLNWLTVSYYSKNLEVSLDAMSVYSSFVICYVLYHLRMLPTIKDFVDACDFPGVSVPIITSGFVDIHVNGLNIQAMREKSDEIKREARFNFLDNNCASVVIDCLKAGLTNEQVKTLPQQCSISTPMDVGDMIDFIIDHEYVELIDQEDNADDQWFDALEYL